MMLQAARSKLGFGLSGVTPGQRENWHFVA